jgi:hypothetical protein
MQDAMQRQGDMFPRHDTRYNITMGQECRKQLKLTMGPIDPHVDIQPTGRYEVFIRHVARRVNGTTENHELACIYTPDGRCQHMLQPQRAALLHHHFVTTLEQRGALMQRLKVGSFAEEAHKLMLRYQEGTKLPGKTENVLEKDHMLTVPNAVYTVLQSYTGACQEKFASPLDVHAGTKVFWGVHQRDQVFGARWDCHKFVYKGISICHPPAEEKHINRSIVTALHDARAEQHAPTLTMFLLPAWNKEGRMPGYHRWESLFPQNCKHILTIPKESVRLLMPVGPAGTKPVKPKEDIDIIA